MATKQLLAPKTAAESTGVTWNSKYSKLDSFVVSAPGLATTEEVDIEFLAGPGTYITYDVSGTPVTLTATQPHATLPAGPRYRFKKDATAAAVGISVSYGS